MLTKKEIEKLQQERNKELVYQNIRFKLYVLIHVIIVAVSMIILAEFKMNLIDINEITYIVHFGLDMLLIVAASFITGCCTYNCVVAYEEYSYYVNEIRVEYQRYLTRDAVLRTAYKEAFGIEILDV